MADYDLTSALQQAPINPESFQRVGLEFLSSKLNGDTLVDVNAPAIHLLEASSSQAAYHIQENFSLDRRHYRLLAQTYNDLYGHMSDADYLDRFSSPGQVTLQYTVALEGLLAAMVEEPDTNVNRVIIPRYTNVSPGGQYPLLLLYPIEIRQLPHDGLQVVYNTDIDSPIQTLTDNVLTWRKLRDTDLVDYLQIDIPMLQLTRTKTIEQVVQGQSRYAFAFGDNYFYTRVFQGTAGAWTELATTHSLQVYDADTPTAVLQVGDGVINVTIPPIYFSNGSVAGNLRVDIYSTLGDITQDLTNFSTDKYSIVWGTDDDDPDLSDYSTAVPNLAYAWVSTDTLTGGAVGLTFEELREKVIYNVTTNSDNSPITPAQIEARLNRLGFDIVKSRDDFTERLYLATTSMPTPTGSAFASGVPVAISTLQTTMATLTQVEGVYDNGDRITVGPDVLFSLNSGVLGLVDNNNRPEVIYTTPETFVNGVNQSNYAYTPFHYVMDASGDTFDFRAYYLENPAQTGRRFLRDNATLLIDVSTSAFAVTRTSTGYRLTVTLTAGDSYLAVDAADRYMQLAFIPYGETSYAYVNGTLLGTTGTTVAWAFDFVTNFDLDSNDNLIVTNFSILEAATRSLALPLTTEFMLLTIVGGDVDTGYQYSAIDGQLGSFLLGSDAKGLAQEYVTLQLGTALDDLWCGARTVAGSYVYQTYSADVYAYYTEDVYEIDPTTNAAKYTIVNGQVVLTKLYSKGDQKLNADGTPMVLHKAGDPVLDSDGNPVAVSARPVTRLVDFLIMDGNYAFVTQASDTSDATWTANNIANTQLPKLAQLGDEVLEKTNISLYPKTTIGSISVIVDDGIEKTINSTLTFSIKFYLTGTAYRDSTYTDALKATTATVLNSGIKTDTVSVSSLIALLKPYFDESVIGFDLHMYSDGTEMTTFTMSDASFQPSIDRIIEYTEDGKYGIKENIDYVFKNHSATS